MSKPPMTLKNRDRRRVWNPSNIEKKIQKNSKKFKNFQKILQKIYSRTEKYREMAIESTPLTPDLVSDPNVSMDSFMGARGVLEQNETTLVLTNPQAPLIVQRFPNVKLTPRQYLMEVVQTEPSTTLLPEQILWFEGRRQQAAIALLPYTERKKAAEDGEEETAGDHEAWLRRLGARS